MSTRKQGGEKAGQNGSGRDTGIEPWPLVKRLSCEGATAEDSCLWSLRGVSRAAVLLMPVGFRWPELWKGLEALAGVMPTTSWIWGL